MVGNILRLMLWRGLSIIRWNNFPRVVDIKHMDNVGFTLHVALYLAYVEEYHFWNSIDKLFLVKKIIFTSLADLILSDINSWTKGYIKKTNSKIFGELYDKAFSYIYDFEWPDFLREDMERTVSDTTHKIEDNIFFAAKKYVGYFESSTNARVFPEMYEVPMREIETALHDISLSVPSIKYLLDTPDSQKYLAHIQRLSVAMRWNQYQRNFPISVMSHKVIVAYLSYVIGLYWNQQGEENDVEDMLMRAIYHDVPEVITGDIITPTKKAVPWFVELLEEVETEMVDDYLFSYISPEYKAYIQNYMLEPFSWEIGKKVKYADNLSALFESKLEDVSGNKSFSGVTHNILKNLSGVDNAAVSYILKDMNLYFEDIKEDILQ